MTQPTVLISDDEPNLVAALTRVAKGKGLTVIPDTSSAALDLVKAHKPNVVLLDLNQPVDGLTMLQILKSDPETKDIPVFVMSGLASPGVQQHARELGAEELLEKSVLSALMEKVAQKARAH